MRRNYSNGMDRKVYYSFHDIPFSVDTGYYHSGYYYRNKSFSTSRTEMVHLVISIFTLSVAFAFAIAGGITGLYYSRDPVMELSYSFIFSFAAILTGFFFHEMSHKYMASRYGLWAEYRMYPLGLMLALLFSVLLGYTIAAPGAVNVAGGARRFEIGRVAAAGPMANIVIGSTFLLLYMKIGLDSIYGAILGFVAMINIFLAFFNLIPFGPLDGRKIIMWNSVVWAGMFTVSLFLLVIIVNMGIIIPGF